MTRTEENQLDFAIDAITFAKSLKAMEKPHQLLMLMGAHWHPSDYDGDNVEEYEIGGVLVMHFTNDDTWEVILNKNN